MAALGGTTRADAAGGSCEDAGYEAAQTMAAMLASAAETAPRAVGQVLRIMRDKFDPQRTKGMKMSIRFDLAGYPSWRVAVDHGKLSVGPSTEDADCIIETSEETLWAVLQGEQNMRTAYMSGRIKVHGDIVLARYAMAA